MENKLIIPNIVKDKINKQIYTEPNTGCHLWSGSSNQRGYGQIFFNKKFHRIHVLSWIMKNGEIKNSLQVLHKCDTPSCVNPSHLFLGTQSDNIKDCVSKGRYSKNAVTKKYCKNGHLMSDENLYIRPIGTKLGGKRLCRPCAALRSKKFYNKNKEIS